MLGKRQILSATVFAVAAVAAVSLSSVASSRTLNSKAHVTITPAPGFTASDLTANPAANWLEPLGDLNGNGYSSLNQINTSNVSTLQSAWQTHFADPACKSGTSCGTPENNPLVYNGVMYLNDPHGSLDALDATTGQRIWQFVPQYAAGTPDYGFTSRHRDGRRAHLRGWNRREPDRGQHDHRQARLVGKPREQAARL